MNELIKFLEQIYYPVCEIQIGEANSAQALEQFSDVEKFISNNRGKNLYFLGNVKAGVKGRAKNEDVVIKNYVGFDFDVRKYFSEQGKEVSDEKIKLVGQRMKEKLANDEVFKNFGAIIFTGNGLHLYFFCPPEEVTNDVYSSGYESLCLELEKILKIKPDISCRNLARIMRLPLSYNNKSLPQRKVEFIYFEAKTSPVLQIILERGKDAKPVSKLPQVTLDKEKLKGLPLWEQLSLIPSRMVLEKLSGDKLVSGEIFTFRRRSTGGEHIDVNGKPADCWLDAAGYIGSGKKAGPTWIQWLRNFYGCTNRAIAEWAKANLKDLLCLESGDKSALDFLPAIESLCGKNSFFTWGTSGLDENFSPLLKGKYVVVVGETGAGKTPFTFNMALKNARLGHRVLYLSMEIKNHALLFKYARDKLGITKREFKEEGVKAEDVVRITKELPPTLLFKELSDTHIETIISVLMQTDADMVIIDNIGIIETSEKELTETVRLISRRLLEVKNRKNMTIIAIHHFRKVDRQSESPMGDLKKLVRNMDNAMGSAKLTHDIEFFIQVVRDKKAIRDEQRAELLVVQQKDRDWGDYAAESVYYVGGEFNDKFAQYEPIPF